MSDSPRASIVVFSDDWGRHPSSCQHLVRPLLTKHHVTWVNTIGTRRPALNWYTIKRGLAKVAGWLQRPAPSTEAPDSSPAPRILNPMMWPSFDASFGRPVNRFLLERALRKSVPALEDSMLVTTIPLVADLVGHGLFKRSIYYCVDDLSQWPGLDRSALEGMEKDLVAKVDDVVAVSDNLVSRMQTLGKSAHLLTHGVDLSHWTTPPADQKLPWDFPKPWIVFWGVVDQRLNVSWLSALNDQLKEGTILLVGPTNLPDPKLFELARLKLTGPLAYERLPMLAAQACVLIMPYAHMPATHAMQPLKLKEYLATGKGVVSADLPAVFDWKDACDIASSADDFVAGVIHRLEGQLPESQRVARQRLQQEGWSAKSKFFESIILGVAPKAAEKYV